MTRTQFIKRLRKIIGKGFSKRSPGATFLTFSNKDKALKNLKTELKLLHEQASFVYGDAKKITPPNNFVFAAPMSDVHPDCRIVVITMTYEERDYSRASVGGGGYIVVPKKYNGSHFARRPKYFQGHLIDENGID